MPNEIILQAGTEFVKTDEIPALIVQALYPESVDEPRFIIKLTKTFKPVVDEGTQNKNGWPTAIEDADQNILNEIFAGLQPPILPIAVDAWQPYAEAFRLNGSQLDWELTYETTSPIAIQRYLAERDHLQMLMSAIRVAKLHTCKPCSRIPVSNNPADSIVLVEELSRYVSELKIGVNVRVINGHDAESGVKHSTTTPQDTLVPEKVDVNISANKKSSAIRVNKTRAFLLDCINTGVPKNIESIWFYIRKNAGKNENEQFFFVTANNNIATTIDGDRVSKTNLSRVLHVLLKKMENA